MLAVTRDEGVDAEFRLLTAAGRRSLRKTLGGGNGYDTGTQKHTACSDTAGTGVVWWSTPNARLAHLRDGSGGPKEGSHHVHNVTHHS